MSQESRHSKYYAFEQIKKKDRHENEYWLARDLQAALGYTSWRSFTKVIMLAKIACIKSGIAVDDNFIIVDRIAKTKSGAVRKVHDIKLSRYACFLIIENGDTRKEKVALRQTYLAIQTRKREMMENGADFTERATSIFIATLTEAKIKREGITEKEAVSQVRQLVERTVQKAVEDL